MVECQTENLMVGSSSLLLTTNKVSCPSGLGHGLQNRVYIGSNPILTSTGRKANTALSHLFAKQTCIKSAVRVQVPFLPPYSRLAEWIIATVLKTVERDERSVSSNLTPTAKNIFSIDK